METRCGTPYYLPPEMVIGNIYQGADADLFSLGVTLFMCHFTCAPFGSAIEGDTFYEELTQSPQNYFNVKHPGVQCSPELRDLIAIMLQPIPA